MKIDSEYTFLVLFDSECMFCNYWVIKSLQLNKKGNLIYASLDSKQFAAYKDEFIKLNSVIFIKDKQYYTYSDAVIEIMRELEIPQILTYTLQLIPKIIRNKVYTILAKNRNRLSKNTACPIVPLHYKKRFLV
jgi:predicted DCC family thiol-disulfide oxidoreductase YuxK